MSCSSRKSKSQIACNVSAVLLSCRLSGRANSQFSSWSVPLQRIASDLNGCGDPARGWWMSRERGAFAISIVKGGDDKSSPLVAAP